MQETLSMLAVVGVISVIGLQTANAFTWSDMNPFNWGKCNKCEKKVEKDCPTGYATPCDPCQKKVEPCEQTEKKIPCTPCQKQKPAPCDPCDKLQQEMAK